MTIQDEIKQRRQQKHKIEFAKQLRKRMTKEESLLWNELRNRKFQNIKFRRQVPIGSYIVDFCSKEYGLIIELDGLSHKERKDYDKERDAFLQSRGYKVLRIANTEIFKNIPNTLQYIHSQIT